jgi:hypothetical protein
MKPQRPYRALRAAIGAIVVMAVTALWIYGQMAGQPLGTLWDVVMLSIVIAAGFAVFGRRTFSAAVDEAESLKRSDSDDE